MKAIEFKARTENGVIEILNDIKNKLQQEVRVILLFDEKEKREEKRLKKARFSATKIRTKGFRFDREEAYGLVLTESNQYETL